MNGSNLGLILGTAGAVVGVLGGLYGTHVGIKNTNGPRERSYAIRAAVLCWVGVSAFLACLVLLPLPWRALAWVVYAPCLCLFARRSNDEQVRIRAEER